MKHFSRNVLTNSENYIKIVIRFIVRGYGLTMAKT